MAYIEGKQRGQHTLFPTTLDDLIREQHGCGSSSNAFELTTLGSKGLLWQQLCFGALRHSAVHGPVFQVPGRSINSAHVKGTRI